MTFLIVNTVKQILIKRGNLYTAYYILHLCSLIIMYGMLSFLLLYCNKIKSNKVKLHKMDLFDPIQYTN